MNQLKEKWYLSTWFILLLVLFSWTYVTIPFALIFLIIRFWKDKNISKKLPELYSQINTLTSNNYQLQQFLNEKERVFNELGINDYLQAKALLDSLNFLTQQATIEKENLDNEIQSRNSKLETINKSVESQTKKLNRIKELYKSLSYAINNFTDLDFPYDNCKIPQKDYDDVELVSPSVILKLHCMDIKSLKKAYKDNEKQITKLLEQYSVRYTTKANKTIYSLMVIALRSELQNILYDLKYEKLDNAIANVKAVSEKYLKLAAEGNQSIAGTLTKFIGEIEYFFINAVKIEYNYYVKKEQAKQEQMAIREQMRQEAEERKALEAERKKVEQEESKYTTEIAKLQEQMTSVPDSELEQYKARILELQAQLADVAIKREEITNLQNGKAGNVYIISNLGSFGENVFKIGMTRRLDPQDRINELGNASVPFKFDVHSIIFSDDAVGLENKLHTLLNNKRLNKVNLRKEFFNVSIDELESLVNDIDSTAEFNKTMLAEEFRQSISSDEVYTSDYNDIPDDED